MQRLSFSVRECNVGQNSLLFVISSVSSSQGESFQGESYVIESFS